jgi:hypothetical protein
MLNRLFFIHLQKNNFHTNFNMKNTLIALFLLINTMGFGQDFYALNTVQTIEINFSQTNWDQLLDNAYATTGDYILAESVSINGEVFDSVGVKYKGNSTYQSNQAKNPFHIELDTYKDHQYEAYTDIKLSNVAKDPSFLREVLSYQILRQYMDAPLSNFANVSVNGTLIGLYSNSEAVSKKFVNSRFYSKKNTFVKCNPPAGAGPQTNDFPNLAYLGQDSSDYYDAYEIKSDDGWEELINLCDTLANNINDIEEILDVDKALWMLAFNNVMVNLDSYSGGFKQNYYLYRDDFGRFLSVVWDLNESIGRFSMAGGTGNNLNSTAAKQQMDHLLHLNDADFPLIQKLLSVPTYKRMYLAHMKTMLLENFDNESYIATAEALQTLIDADVQADNNKFFTYANFTTNLNADINSGGGPGGGSTPGITNLMDGRNDYLLGLSDFTQTDPTISNITASTPTPIINETITITAAVTDADEVTFGYRTELGAPFTKLAMFDDGAHNDAAAGDGVYGTDLTITNAFVQYFIYAENSNAGKFSPQRAQFEYYTLTATTSNPTVGDLVINEFMASNDATIADQAGEFDDWIEFYNNSSTTIDLEGYFLSDDANNLMKWAFLPGAVIEGNGYAIVWADNDEAQVGLHANFKLSAAAESIFLSKTNGTIVDEVSYINQTSDISFGRIPNGVGDFQIMSPTFNAENMGTTSISNTPVETFHLKASPNPADDSFLLEIEGNEGEELNISVYNLNGIVVYQDLISKNKFIHTYDWAAGMYIVRVDHSFLKIVIN